VTIKQLYSHRFAKFYLAMDSNFFWRLYKIQCWYLKILKHFFLDLWETRQTDTTWRHRPCYAYCGTTKISYIGPDLLQLFENVTVCFLNHCTQLTWLIL